MRHRKIANVPYAAIPVSPRLTQAAAALDRITRIVTAAMAVALLFLAVRIVGHF